MNTRLLGILQHSLGLDQHGLYKGAPVGYRNHFVTGEGQDFDDCQELVTMGYMVEHAARAIFGGEPCFTVTDEGKRACREHSPVPPKKSRAQQRYQQWLSEDSSLKFGEWLKNLKHRERAYG